VHWTIKIEFLEDPIISREISLKGSNESVTSSASFVACSHLVLFRAASVLRKLLRFSYFIFDYYFALIESVGYDGHLQLAYVSFTK